MITIDNLNMSYPLAKSYKDHILKPFSQKSIDALYPLSLKIEEGDKIAFLGANGAGKTTLLKLVGGLLYPTKGRIEVNGFDTQVQNMNARKSVGFVLNEERSFYWRLTGRQNLEFFGSLDNLKGQELNDRIHELLNLVGLTDAADNDFAGYSSGMKQRLAIARGLLAYPKVLILDEPTRTLDPIAKMDIKELIYKRIHLNQDHTLLIATHDLEEAKNLCNRVIIMKKGRILLDKPMNQILEEYNNLHNCYLQTMDGINQISNNETQLHYVS